MCCATTPSGFSCRATTASRNWRGWPFCRMPGEVRKVIRISELDDLFDIHDELDDALISLRGGSAAG